MAELDLNPTIIARNLSQSAQKHTQNQPDTIPVIRVEQSTLSKELAKFRACDDFSRCFYCREWSQLIYKKHFTWNAKTQEKALASHQQGQPGKSGKLGQNSPVQRKDKLSSLCKRLEKLIDQHKSPTLNKAAVAAADRSPPASSEFKLMEEVFAKTAEWIKIPSCVYTLPALFAPVEFDTFPHTVPFPKDPSDPSHILDPLIIDKFSLSLPCDGFSLLKNVTREVLLSHMQPTCQHTPPDWKTPNDLEIDRSVFRDELEKLSKTTYHDVSKELDTVWAQTNLFLGKAAKLEVERDRLFGSGCLTDLSEFIQTHRDRLQNFNEYWAPVADAHKRSGKAKKGSAKSATKESSEPIVDDIDFAFSTYLNGIQDAAVKWNTDFMNPRYDLAQQFVQNVWDTLITTLGKAVARMAQNRIDKYDEYAPEKCNQALKTLQLLNPSLELSSSLTRLQTDVAARMMELTAEIDSTRQAWEAESQRTVYGRLEKAANKEFRKRIKKLEHMHQSIRQFCVNELNSVFPEHFFARISLKCLECLLLEGEIMEAMSVNAYSKRFEPISQKLNRRRKQLLDDFEEGVMVGRRELAGIIGRLLLKEGLRIQEGSVALKKQNILLKKIGRNPETSPTRRKKGSLTQQQLDVASNEKGNLSDSEMIAATVTNSKKNKKKKKGNGLPSADADNKDSLPPSPTATKAADDTISPVFAEKKAPTRNNVKPVVVNFGELQNNRQLVPQIVNFSKAQTAVQNQTQANGMPLLGRRAAINHLNDQVPAQQETVSLSDGPVTEQCRDSADLVFVSLKDEVVMPNEPVQQWPDPHRKGIALAPSPQESYPKSPALSPTAYNNTTFTDPVPLQASHNPSEVSAVTDTPILKLESFNQRELIALVRSLHFENAQLVTTLVNMQQEVSNLNNRFVDIAHEREFQTIQMMEARKNAEMEEARRYIQALEFRITQLEKEREWNLNHAVISPAGSQIPADHGAGNDVSVTRTPSSPSPKPIGSPSTNSFSAVAVVSGQGNTSPSGTTTPVGQITSQPSGFALKLPFERKKFGTPHPGGLWAHGKVVLRCGNCGDAGHTSMECKDACRYCGNLQHLSEDCTEVMR